MRHISAKIILGLLAILGYLGGYMHTVIEVAEKSGIEPLALAMGSLSTAIVSALLCGAAAITIAVAPDGTARLKPPTPLGECATAALFFTAGSAGLRATLWVLGG